MTPHQEWKPFHHFLEGKSPQPRKMSANSGAQQPERSYHHEGQQGIGEYATSKKRMKKLIRQWQDSSL